MVPESIRDTLQCPKFLRWLRDAVGDRVDMTETLTKILLATQREDGPGPTYERAHLGSIGRTALIVRYKWAPDADQQAALRKVGFRPDRTGRRWQRLSKSALAPSAAAPWHGWREYAILPGMYRKR